MVQVKDKEGAVIVRDGAFFFTRGAETRFIFRVDQKGALVYTQQQ